MKKIMGRQEAGIPWQNLLIYLLVAYVVTAAFLFLLAFLLFKLSLSEQIISVGIIATYVLSCFVAGFLAGKKMKQKRFLWGLVMGMAYFGVLFVLSLAMNRTEGTVTDALFTTMILCTGGGMLGGMLS